MLFDDRQPDENKLEERQVMRDVILYMSMSLDGRALFDQLPGARHLNLVEALSFPSGVVVHIYRPQNT